MTRVQMRALFWELVGLPSNYARTPGYVDVGGSASGDGPDLDLLIWSAISDMVKVAQPVHVRKKASLSVTTTGLVALPTDFLAYQGVEEPPTINGRPLAPTRQGESIQMSADTAWENSDTAFWFEAGVDDDGTTPSATFGRRMIGVYPLPTATVTMVLPYVRKPIKLTATGMADGTEYPDLPEAYHEAPVYRAAAKFFERQTEKSSKPTEVWLSYFQEQVQLLVRETNELLQGAFRSRTPNFLTPAVESWMPV